LDNFIHNLISDALQNVSKLPNLFLKFTQTLRILKCYFQHQRESKYRPTSGAKIHRIDCFDSPERKCLWRVVKRVAFCNSVIIVPNSSVVNLIYK
jgi:hypothetical protein